MSSICAKLHTCLSFCESEATQSRRVYGISTHRFLHSCVCMHHAVHTRFDETEHRARIPRISYLNWTQKKEKPMRCKSDKFTVHGADNNTVSCFPWTTHVFLLNLYVVPCKIISWFSRVVNTDTVAQRGLEVCGNCCRPSLLRVFLTLDIGLKSFTIEMTWRENDLFALNVFLGERG